MLRRTAVADRITGASNSVEPLVDDSTRTSCPHLRRLWPRPTILRRDMGLAASPPARYTLRVARRENPPCLCLLPSAGTDKLLAKRWRAPRTGTRRRPRRMSAGLRMQPRNQSSLPCRQGPNAERAAISPRSSRHASAGPRSPNGRLTVAAAHIGRHPSERPDATSPRSWPGSPATEHDRAHLRHKVDSKERPTRFGTAADRRGRTAAAVDQAAAGVSSRGRDQ